MQCDTLYTNAEIFNTALKRIYRGFFAVRGNQVVRIGEGEPPETINAAKVVDLGGKTVVPGLIDIHTHIESAMLTPWAFASELARRGVTTIVSEPHEIANVAGMAGVEAMITAAEGAPIDIYYGIPSSVPCSSPALETTGGVIDVDEVLALMDNPGVKCLGEVMNVTSVVNEPDGKTNRIVRAFKQKSDVLPVEGHCPRLVGDELAEYMAAGIDSDHTEHSFEEFRERLFNGMLMELQDKSISQELFDFIIENDLFNNVALVTDDVMPHELVEQGHLDYIVRRAIETGFSPEQAVYCATKVPADRMRLFDRGEIRPGKLADFVVLDEVASFDVNAVYKSGALVYSKAGGDAFSASPKVAFPSAFNDSIKLGDITPETFGVKCGAGAKSATCRLIVNASPSTHTKESEITLPARDGLIDWEKNAAGALLIAVLERYGINGNIGFGFLSGIVHNKGAVASSYCHDHHNVMVAGENAADMALAVNKIKQMRGGLAVALGGEIIASAALPVGGIMSGESAAALAKDVGAVTVAMEQLGYRHIDPIMSFCTLPLAVSPALKITDCGLVDVMAQKLLPLIKSEQK